MVKYELPLNEVVFDFYAPAEVGFKRLCSFDYHLTDYSRPDLVKMQSGQQRAGRCAVDAGAPPACRGGRGRAMVEKMKELIPPHMFQIPIQAAIGGKVIARETVRALRKDFTAKCYGGDITASANFWRSRRKARRRCGSSARVDIPPGSVHRGVEGG